MPYFLEPSLRRSFLLVLGLNLTLAMADTSQSESLRRRVTCSQANWKSLPLQKTTFSTASFRVECQIQTQQSLSQISQRIREALEKQRTHHLPVQVKGKKRIYDVSHDVNERGDSMWLRENVVLEEKDEQLIYDAQSTEIKGSGISSNLRSIHFHASLTQGLGIRAHFKTEIQIARPWFAPAFMFFRMARTQTAKKVEMHAEEFATKIAASEGPISP